MSARHPIGFITPPQFAQGKLTFIGLILAVLGMAAGKFGWTFPKEEADGIATWLAANWDTLSEGAGLLTTFYGRLRINWRRN